MYTDEEIIIMTIMILKSLALNYPILNMWGIEFPKLIVIVTSESAKLINVLKNFRSEGKKNSDFRFLIHSNNSKISDFARSYSQGLADGCDASMGFPIVITENPIVDEDTNDKFYIFIDDQIKINHIDRSELHPNPDELEIIRKAIMEYESVSNSREELCLYAASCFIRSINSSITIEKNISIINELVERNEAARERGNYTNLCLECLYKYQEIKGFSSIYHKSMIDAVGIGNNMFYDEKFLYIPESLFKEVIAPLRKHASLYTIMEEIAEDGFLVTDNSKGYTVKMNCRNTSDIRPRALRIDLSRLTVPGELSFIDKCEMLKEE